MAFMQCADKVLGFGMPNLYSRGVVLRPIADLMEWTTDAEARLKEIPFFVRPAARKKIEKFAQAAGTAQITVEIYEQAKQQFG
jgi:Proto-chlorophyllide reductase 57 kD subunit